MKQALISLLLLALLHAAAQEGIQRDTIFDDAYVKGIITITYVIDTVPDGLNTAETKQLYAQGTYKKTSTDSMVIDNLFPPSMEKHGTTTIYTKGSQTPTRVPFRTWSPLASFIWLLIVIPIASVIIIPLVWEGFSLDHKIDYAFQKKRERNQLLSLCGAQVVLALEATFLLLFHQDWMLLMLFAIFLSYGLLLLIGVITLGLTTKKFLIFTLITVSIGILFMLCNALGVALGAAALDTPLLFSAGAKGQIPIVIALFLLMPLWTAIISVVRMRKVLVSIENALA